MSKEKETKDKEYFFSGSWESRIPAMFYLCLIVAGWFAFFIKDFGDNRFGEPYGLILAFGGWIILTLVLFSICKFIAGKIMAQNRKK